MSRVALPTMKTIDPKSLLIGILATVLVMVTVGAVGKPSSEIGRYQLLTHGDNPSPWLSMLLCDTTNGDTFSIIDDIENGWIKHIEMSGMTNKEFEKKRREEDKNKKD